MVKNLAYVSSNFDPFHKTFLLIHLLFCFQKFKEKKNNHYKFGGKIQNISQY